MNLRFDVNFRLDSKICKELKLKIVALTIKHECLNEREQENEIEMNGE